MTIKLTWYSHACFLFQVDNIKLLIDPFLSNNPLAPIQAKDIRPDFILVSHGHSDHFGDTIEIAKETDATVISNFEIHNYLLKQGVKNVHPLHIGGSYRFSWGRLKFTIAHHGSSLPDGSYGGNPCGFLFYIHGKKIYHACDTGLFYDMKLIGDEGIDVAILPIGDNFTMGPEDALRAVKLISPSQVIPIHYNTFDIIKQNPDIWSKLVEKESTSRVRVLVPGETITV